MDLNGKNVLVGITGGIAAYKVCELIRMYKRAGAAVKTVVTKSALEFVTKLTLQTLTSEKVYDNNFDTEDYSPEHIALCDWADVFVIAPATANTISKISAGIADNLLTSLVCACTKPILIAPAMNCNMYRNPIIQENISKLRALGYNFVEPESGFLACGTEGVGRLASLELIYQKTQELLYPNQFLKGKNVLITAGGTLEKIDPVRYISNFSSGKMGLALADAAVKMGANVTLVSTFKAEGSFKNIVTQSADEMLSVVRENYKNQDCVIMAAAVADWKVKNYSENKVKKGVSDSWNIELVKNPDILKTICSERVGKSPMIVGFSAESENLLENATIKIQAKGCDYIIANDISKKNSGFASDYNEVYVINKNLEMKFIERSTKQDIAKKILESVFEQELSNSEIGSVCSA